jgi:hypothetical protein
LLCLPLAGCCCCGLPRVPRPAAGGFDVPAAKHVLRFTHLQNVIHERYFEAHWHIENTAPYSLIDLLFRVEMYDARGVLVGTYDFEGKPIAAQSSVTCTAFVSGVDPSAAVSHRVSIIALNSGMRAVQHEYTVEVVQ